MTGSTAQGNGDDLYVFPWIGENDYVIKGSPDSIAFGSGE